MALQPIADDLWGADSEQPSPGGVVLPLRMVVARLSAGGLLLFAPKLIDDELASELDALGEVRFVVAPNGFHHLHVAACSDRYPDAKVLISPALVEKRPDLEHTGVLGDEAEAGWADDLDQLVVRGAPKIDEVVFFHRATGTLLVTDLVFNVTKPRGFMTHVILWLGGAHGRLAQSRFWRLMVKDRAAAAASASRLLDWDIQRVVPSHGDIVDDDAASRLRSALSWMTSAAPALPPRVA